MDCRLS